MSFSDELKKIGKGLGATGGLFPAMGGFGGFNISEKRGYETKANELSGAFAGNPFAPLSTNLRNMGVLGDDKTTRLITGILAPSSAVNQTIFDERQQEKFLDKTKEFFEGKDPNVPMVRERPSSGARNQRARNRARNRAEQDAAQTRGLGLSGTIATTPLGLQGDGAAVSQRRLIGE